MSLYPELVALSKERDDIKIRITEAMKARFLGKRVRVNHHHGSFTGVVRQAGWDGEFSVMVKNDVTGKSSRRWPLSTSRGLPDVELIDDESHAEGGKV